MFQDCFQIWYVHSTSYSETSNIYFSEIDQVVLKISILKIGTFNPFTDRS